MLELAVTGSQQAAMAYCNTRQGIPAEATAPRFLGNGVANSFPAKHLRVCAFTGNETGQSFLPADGQPQCRGWKCPAEQQKDHKMLDAVCCQQPVLKAPLEAAAGIQL